jgi:DNA polymerase III alpha subunit (gram-positive type)
MEKSVYDQEWEQPQGSYAALVKRVQEKEKRIKQLEAEYKEGISRRIYEIMKRSLEETVSQRDQIIEKQKTEIAKKNTINEILRKYIKEIKHQLDEANEQYNAVNQAKTTVQKENTALIASNADLFGKLQQCEDRIKEYMKENRALSQQSEQQQTRSQQIQQKKQAPLYNEGAQEAIAKAAEPQVDELAEDVKKININSRATAPPKVLPSMPPLSGSTNAGDQTILKWVTKQIPVSTQRQNSLIFTPVYPSDIPPQPQPQPQPQTEQKQPQTEQKQPSQQSNMARLLTRLIS